MIDRPWQRIGRELAVAAFGVPLETLDAAVIDRLTEVFDEVPVRAGQVLGRAGAVVDALWVMHDGRVRATRDGAPSWTFEGRWFLGDLESHLDGPATRTLVAVKNFHAFKVGRRVWHGLLEDSFELTRLSVSAAAASMARLDARLGNERPSVENAVVPLAVDRPLSVVERLAFLAELPIARDAGVQALADLAAVAPDIWIAPGEAVFDEGEQRECFFVVVSGVVEGCRRQPDVARRYHAGEVVAGAAALSEEIALWRARAGDEGARLLAIPFEAWFDLMESHFDVAHATLAALARERERILDRLASESGDGGAVFR